jgi:hypothetical protein
VKASLLKVYYKAAAWPAFYVISLPTVIVLFAQYVDDPDFSMNLFSRYLVLVSFYSGLIAVSCAGLFLCTIRKIACNFYYSLLAWFLLPVSIMAYVFLEQIDISAIERPKDPEMILVAIMATIVMIHLIGLIISFNAFRASMILQIREEKRNPALKEVYVVRELKSMDEKVS